MTWIIFYVPTGYRSSYLGPTISKTILQIHQELLLLSTPRTMFDPSI